MASGSTSPQQRLPWARLAAATLEVQYNQLPRVLAVIGRLPPATDIFKFILNLRLPATR